MAWHVIAITRRLALVLWTDWLADRHVPYNKAETLIRDTKSFEGYNIALFVADFNAGGEADPRSLIDTLSTNLVDKFGIDEFDATVTLEEYIFPQIYQRCLALIEEPHDDLLIEQQCRTFADVEQHHTNILPKFYDRSLIPYADAIATLRGIFFASSPIRKLYANDPSRFCSLSLSLSHSLTLTHFYTNTFLSSFITRQSILRSAKAVYQTIERVAPGAKGSDR